MEMKRQPTLSDTVFRRK